MTVDDNNSEKPAASDNNADSGGDSVKISAVDTGKRVEVGTVRRGKREPEIFRKAAPTTKTAMKVVEGSQAENADTLEGAPAEDAVTVEKPILASQGPILTSRGPEPRRDDRG